VIFDYIVRGRPKETLLQAALLAFSCVALLAQGSSPSELDYHLEAQSVDQEAVDGRLWLYAAGWGWLDRVQLGRVVAGNLKLSLSDAAFPAGWAFAPNQGYLVALETNSARWYRSSMIISHQEPQREAIDRPALRDLLPRLIEELGSPKAGRDVGKTLVLPTQAARRITLLHEDGTPLVGETVGVDLIIWRQNHCGAAVGLGWGSASNAALGTFTTDERGSLSVIAPDAALVLRRRHFPIVDTGEGAALRQAADVVEVPAGSDVTIRSLWSNPPHREAAIRVLSPTGEPISGLYVDWSINTKTCGTPIEIAGPSDADGWIRFAVRLPVSLTLSMAVYNSDVREGGPWDKRLLYRLSREELLRFASEGSITLRLAKAER
jgi:hypothetical protein